MDERHRASATSRDRQRSWSTCNITVNALRFLYHTTLKRDRTTFCVPSPRQPGTLPAILSREEIERLISHAQNPKHRTMLLTTYAAGLRLNEVIHLRVSDLDSSRMTIRVEQGKGGKDRYTILSRRLLEALRAYWKITRPSVPDWSSRTSCAPTATRIVTRIASPPSSTARSTRSRLAAQPPSAAIGRRVTAAARCASPTTPVAIAIVRSVKR